jgi:hypothetical protein
MRGRLPSGRRPSRFGRKIALFDSFQVFYNLMKRGARVRRPAVPTDFSSNSLPEMEPPAR